MERMKTSAAGEFSEDLSVFADAFILERLSGIRELSEEKTRRRMDILNIRMDAPQYLTVTFAPYLMSKDAELIDKTLSAMLHTIKNGYKKAGLIHYAVTDASCNIVVIVALRDAMDLKSTDNVTCELTAALMKKHEIDMYVGIGKPVTQFSEIHKSREAAKEALAYKFTFAHNHVVWAKDVERIFNQSTIKLGDYTARILGSFYDGNISLLSSRLDELIVVVESTMENPLSSMKNLCIELTASVSQRTREIGLNMFDDRADVYAGILKMPDIGQLRGWFIDLCDSAIKGISEVRRDKNTQIVNLSIAYMEEHLGDTTLSLQTVSDSISLSAPYFSELFFNQTGMHITAYINKLRVDKARELLLKTNLKAADIALTVGFSSANYFNNVFKQSTGLPPQKYRLTFGRNP